MIRKLINLVKNYDKIMQLIEEKPVKKSSKASKRVSFLNTPQNQLDYIENVMKGDKK